MLKLNGSIAQENLSANRLACGGSRMLISAACAAALAAGASAYAGPTGIGLSALLTANPSLTGAGVNVAQVEASLNQNPPPYTYEVNPADVYQPQSLFTYIDNTNTSSSTYSSTNGSIHANTVGGLFYGGAPSTGSAAIGVAPGVASVANYEASGFAGYEVGLGENSSTQMITHTGQSKTVNNAAVINQSFNIRIPTGYTTSQADQYMQNIDWGYDQYVNTDKTVIVSAVGNYSSVSGTPDMINPPATAYNSIAVGSYNGGTEVGPTFDGRSKPDIVAPASESSYAAPLVSGAAALMIQAGNQADGYTAASAGGWTQSTYKSNAVLPQTVKALLMNGAVQPTGWTHTATAPLDPKYGAGVLNVDNAYNILTAGRAAMTVSNTSTTVATTPTITQASGWDVESLTNNGSLAVTTATTYVNHYAFTAMSAASGLSDAFKATLVWNAQTSTSVTPVNTTYTEKQTPIFLELFNAKTKSLVSESISTVDNVQQIDALLTPGSNYDLQVLTSGGNAVNSDTYALAFSTTAVATPEPAALSLLVAGGLLLALRSRKRTA